MPVDRTMTPYYSDCMTYTDEPLPFPDIPCYVCGTPVPWDLDEACEDCMNPPMPNESWYYDGPGDEPGWQDSTFPNEY